MSEESIDTGQQMTLQVAGMTCGHCVLSVEEEIAEVEGVATVSADLESGRVLVTGSGVDEAAVRAAVATAGYEVVP